MSLIRSSESPEGLYIYGGGNNTLYWCVGTTQHILPYDDFATLCVNYMNYEIHDDENFYSNSGKLSLTDFNRINRTMWGYTLYNGNEKICEMYHTTWEYIVNEVNDRIKVNFWTKLKYTLTSKLSVS